MESLFFFEASNHAVMDTLFIFEKRYKRSQLKRSVALNVVFQVFDFSGFNAVTGAGSGDV